MAIDMGKEETMQLRFHLKTLHHAPYHQSDCLFPPVVFHICTPQLQLEQLAIPAIFTKAVLLCYNQTFSLELKQLQLHIDRKDGWRCPNLI